MLISWKNQIVNIGSMVASHYSCFARRLTGSLQRPNSTLRLILYFFILYCYQSKMTLAEIPTIELCCEIRSFISLSSVLLQSKINELLFMSNMTFTSLIFTSFLFLYCEAIWQRAVFYCKWICDPVFYLLVVGKEFFY